MYGYDDTHACLIDTASQGGPVRTTLASLELARDERGPMTARNLSYAIVGPPAKPDLGDAIRAAIPSNAQAFLNPPIANLGHRGIGTAARKVTRWLDRSSDPHRDLSRAAMLIERGGTGGALFRAMYRDFLAECATVVDDENLRLGHRMYAVIAPLWTEVSHHIATAGETGDPGHLTRAAAVLDELADKERHAMRILTGVGNG
jgi:hypothetical protein